MSAYTEFISKLCELAIKLKRVALKDKEVENTEFNMCKADVKWQRQELEETQNTECYADVIFCERKEWIGIEERSSA